MLHTTYLGTDEGETFSAVRHRKIYLWTSSLGGWRVNGVGYLKYIAMFVLTVLCSSHQPSAPIQPLVVFYSMQPTPRQRDALVFYLNLSPLLF